MLAVTVGLAGTVVLTAAAGARRTDSAYGRFLAASNAADVLVAPDNTGFGGYYPALAKLPGVEAMAPVIGVSALPVGPGGRLLNAQVYASADELFGHVVAAPASSRGDCPDESGSRGGARRACGCRLPASAAASPRLRRNRQHRVSRPTD